MQSFSINLDPIDHIPNEWIKSLSDDDDDDQKDLHQYFASNPLQKHIHLPLHPDLCTVHSDSTQESEEENEGIIHHEPEDDDDDEAFDILNRPHLLDKDKSIAKTLHNAGYKVLNKLCFTDQGSVWRAKSPKSLGSKSVVIKIASKIHYQHQHHCDDEDDENKSNTNSIATTSEHEDIVKEIELLQHLNAQLNSTECTCPHLKNSIIEVLDTIEDDDNYMMVMEYGGCDLFHFISGVHEEIKEKKITIKEWQKTVKLIAHKVLQLMHWLHSEMFVCHSDISLENLLIDDIEWITYPDQYKHYKKRLAPHFRIQMIDFGAAQCFKEMNSFESCSLVGKPTYCCPDIYKLQNKLSVKSFDARNADLWSFGVACFIMAIGCPPWTHPHENNELFQTIVVERNLNFVLKAWNKQYHLEDSMKDLLQQIFVMDEKNRISTSDIMEHYF